MKNLSDAGGFTHKPPHTHFFPYMNLIPGVFSCTPSPTAPLKQLFCFKPVKMYLLLVRSEGQKGYQLQNKGTKCVWVTGSPRFESRPPQSRPACPWFGCCTQREGTPLRAVCVAPFIKVTPSVDLILQGPQHHKHNT